MQRPSPVVRRLELKLSDFDIVRRLGEGSFSTCILARYRWGAHGLDRSQRPAR
jgi:hypothetical protein